MSFLVSYGYIYKERKNYKKHANLDVIAFSYAHGGAQGFGGDITIITRDGSLYSMNHVYGDMDFEMICEVCPPLRDCIFGFTQIEMYPNGWKGRSLGAGNFLVLKEPLFS